MGWKNYLGSGRYIGNAIKKYGEENFTKYIIKECSNAKELSEQEEYFLEKYKAYEKNNNFYNISKNSDGGWLLDGYTEEDMKKYSEKMSKVIKEKYKNDENYRNNISKAVKKAFEKEEVKINHSNGQKRRFSREEEKQKLKENLKNRWKSEEFRQKYSEQFNLNVYMIDDNGNIVKTFKHMKFALEYLGVKSHTTLLKSIRSNLTIKYKGYYWKRDEK